MEYSSGHLQKKLAFRLMIVVAACALFIINTNILFITLIVTLNKISTITITLLSAGILLSLILAIMQISKTYKELYIE
jgi:hypothetical protein